AVRGVERLADAEHRLKELVRRDGGLREGVALEASGDRPRRREQSTGPHALNGLAGVVEITERPQAELSADGRAGLEAIHQPRLAGAPDRVVQDEDTAKGLAATVGRAAGAVGLVRVEFAAKRDQFLVGDLAVFRLAVDIPEPHRDGGPFG